MEIIKKKINGVYQEEFVLHSAADAELYLKHFGNSVVPTLNSTESKEDELIASTAIIEKKHRGRPRKSETNVKAVSNNWNIKTLSHKEFDAAINSRKFGTKKNYHRGPTKYNFTKFKMFLTEDDAKNFAKTISATAVATRSKNAPKYVLYFVVPKDTEYIDKISSCRKMYSEMYKTHIGNGKIPAEVQQTLTTKTIFK